jgi:hypothetical protein
MQMKSTSFASFAVAAVITGLFTCPALGVKTEHFVQSTTEDFSAGTLNNSVVNNHGQVRLNRKITSLLSADTRYDAISAAAVTRDGAVVFGIFPEAELFILRDSKVTSLAKFAGQHITAIAIDTQDQIYIALTGDSAARVLRIKKPGDEPEPVFADDAVSYIWSMIPVGDRLLLGSGPDATVYGIADGKSRVLTKLSGRNVTAMVLSKDQQTLYAGVDDIGLVYGISLKTAEARVLFDAGDADINALAIDASGNVLAAAGRVKSDGEGEDADIKPTAGVPESDQSNPITSDKPAEPKPPEKSAEQSDNHLPAPRISLPVKVDQDVNKETDKKVEDVTDDDSALDDAPASPAADIAPGSAVYRIAANGTASELYRTADADIYTVVTTTTSVLIGTGDAGQLIELFPDNEENAVLQKTDAGQMTMLLPGPDAGVIAVGSNAGAILDISPGYAPTGTFVSPVLDASVASALGTMQINGLQPPNTRIDIRIRTGNTADPERGGWSAWSAPVPAKKFLSPVTPGISPARYLQYELTLHTAVPDQSPVVDDISLAYQKPNAAPRVTSLTVVPAAKESSKDAAHDVAWEAIDVNDDTLHYALHVRTAGQRAWATVAEKLTETTHTWSTRDVPDGRYQLRVTASDVSDNQPEQAAAGSRTSDAFTIDNTPPVIGDVKITSDVQDKKPVIFIRFRVVDRTGTVAKADYSIDKTNDWQRTLPDDTIADSPDERYTIALKDLSAGQHTLTVRGTDDHGNAAVEIISVNVPASK